MALTCRNAVRLSTAALGGHADESQRLELEAHLARCPACSAEHEVALAVVRGLKGDETDTLAPAARDAVRRALDMRPAAAGLPAGRRRRPLAIAAGLAVAAAAGFCLVALRGRSDEVIAGDVAVERGAEVGAAPSVAFRSTSGGRIRLGDATVDLARATAVAWAAAPRRLDLGSGAVTVDVVHRPGQHLEVRTARFSVEVVGTRFTVDAAGVSCERGLVRVRRPDGRVAASLGAGEGWRLDEAPGAGPPANPAAVDPATGGGLAAARRALAQGDAAGARRLATPLFRLGREVAVEARVIVAESFLVEGRYADAIDGYELVVRDFPTAEQAESAAFAIAQLESEHGRAADARAALRAYMSRYPHGRFQPEAAARLRRLASRAR